MYFKKIKNFFEAKSTKLDFLNFIKKEEKKQKRLRWYEAGSFWLE